MTDSTAPKIFASLNAIMQDLCVEGIAKSKQASMGGAGQYKFRGIDDVYNELGPLLAKHGVIVTPSYYELTNSERTSSKGGTMYHSTVRGTFTFYSIADGSAVIVECYGEASDYGDKAVGKAQSYAFKDALIKGLCIPTEGDNDPDATVHPPSKPKAINLPLPPKPRMTDPPTPKAAPPLVVAATPTKQSGPVTDHAKEQRELKIAALGRVKVLAQELDMNRLQLVRVVWETLKRDVDLERAADLMTVNEILSVEEALKEQLQRDQEEAKS